MYHQQYGARAAAGARPAGRNQHACLDAGRLTSTAKSVRGSPSCWTVTSKCSFQGGGRHPRSQRLSHTPGRCLRLPGAAGLSALRPALPGLLSEGTCWPWLAGAGLALSADVFHGLVWVLVRLQHGRSGSLACLLHGGSWRCGRSEMVWLPWCRIPDMATWTSGGVTAQSRAP